MKSRREVPQFRRRYAEEEQPVVDVTIRESGGKVKQLGYSDQGFSKLKDKNNKPIGKRDIKKAKRVTALVEKAGKVFGVTQARDINTLMREGQVDASIVQFQKTAYSSIINLISVAEEEYLKGRREHQAYVLNSLISTARELAADVAASTAKNDMSGIIAREILEPMFRTLLQDIMVEQVQLKAILSDKLPDKFVGKVSDEMDTSIKRLAEKMTAHFTTTREQIAERMA